MILRSIRLSLIVYFLGLLAAALGVASVILYQTAQGTLEAKKEKSAELIEAHYKERCRAEEAKLDDDLLSQAQTVARVAQFQLDFSRLRHHELNALGVLAAATAPNGYLTTPAWAAQGVRSPYFFDLNRKLLGEITFDDNNEVLEQVAEYYQIDSVWGASQRSRSLGDRAFPVGPDAFAAEQGPPYEFSDYDLPTDGLVRRVTFKTSARIAPSPRHGRGDFPHSGRPGEPSADASQPQSQPSEPRFRDDRPPQQPRELQPRSAIYIQCAASTRHRDQLVAALRADRDGDLAALDAETGASLADLRNRLLLTGVITFAAAVLGCYLLVWLGLAPLRRLSEAVSRVSEKDFRLPVDQRRMPGELKPIVRRLSETLEMLKRAFEREKQATADISHELRTPLAALLTTTEIGLRKPRSPEEYQELLRDCRLSAQQMTQAVERLLALARLDAGVDRLRPQSVDAAELAEQCAALVRPLAEARGLTLTFRRAGPAPLNTDPDKLREILTNLLHNAVEYNRPNGAIDLSVARDDGRLEVEVKDTGVGIGPEAKTHLFERFYRADPSRAGDGLHAGLGLAIVKGYIDLMGGEIAVESTEGQGSSFRVRLPANQA